MQGDRFLQELWDARDRIRVRAKAKAETERKPSMVEEMIMEWKALSPEGKKAFHEEMRRRYRATLEANTGPMSPAREAARNKQMAREAS